MEKTRLECECGYVVELIPDESINGNYEIIFCPSCGDSDINIEEEDVEDE